MNEMLKRTEMLIGTDGIEKLKNSHVAVFGLGGVGGICTEALARSGVGKLTIIDRGVVTPSNINRQIIATTATIGANKVDAMAERIRLISPGCEVNTIKTFFLMGDDGKVVFSDFDYIIDAVDVITAKIQIILLAKEANVPLLSVMGTGNRLDPTKIRIGELFETSVQLERVIIPEGVTVIRGKAFDNCHNLCVKSSEDVALRLSTPCIPRSNQPNRSTYFLPIRANQFLQA